MEPDTSTQPTVISEPLKSVERNYSELLVGLGLYVATNLVSFFVIRANYDHSLDTVSTIDTAIAALPLLLSAQGLHRGVRMYFRAVTYILPLLVIYLNTLSDGGLGFFTPIALLIAVMLLLLWRDKARGDTEVVQQKPGSFSTPRVIWTVATILFLAFIVFAAFAVYSLAHTSW